MALAAIGGIGAEESEPVPITSPPSYTKLSLEELMDVEVTAVSRSPERLSQTPSAVQVVGNEEIRRSGATNLAEALRLAPNIQVAQVNASQWAISSRGFNNVLANKLLVMIDGRTVYTPLYAGVFWDVQSVLLEDVDRIEVVSGPGGTMWGANAVNGVVNVVSKSAEDTQGTYANATIGSAVRNSAAIRSGARIAPDLFLRVYGQRSERAETQSPEGDGAGDDWGMSQGGFRLDWKPADDVVTFQGDAYEADPDPDGTTPVTARGGNLLGRWQRSFSDSSDMQVQTYYDWTLRDLNNGFAEELHTYDVDWQHRFPLGSRQEVSWGLGYRVMDDRVQNLPGFAFKPGDRVMRVYSAFLQDEVLLVEDLLRLTVGSKFERNDFTGFEYQPSARLALTPNDRNAVWAAVSRAVRTPSRIDTDFELLLTPTFPVIQTDPEFESEKLIAYELGWRVQPLETVSLSVATFYNQYDDLRSAEPGPPPTGYPLTFANGVEGNTYGMELSGEARPVDWWRVRGGCTFLRKRLRVSEGSQDLNEASAESNDPRQQYLLQSMFDLPWNVQFDGVLRYVGALPDPHIPGYVGLDLRLAMHPAEHIEVAVVGQNLIDDQHVEFIPASPTSRELGRSVYGSLTARW